MLRVPHICGAKWGSGAQNVWPTQYEVHLGCVACRRGGLEVHFVLRVPHICGATGGMFPAVSGRLQPSPAVSSRLRPSPAVSGLKGASGFPLKIVNWPLVNGKLDSNQLASKSDPLVFHRQTISNSLEAGGWELVAGDWLLGLHSWWKWVSPAWLVAGD